MTTETNDPVRKEPGTLHEEILKNLGQPQQLEKLYHGNKTDFKKTFNRIFPDIQESPAAQVWNARLNYETEEISWGTKQDWWFVLAAALLAGLVAKIPDFFSIHPEFFYPRNLSFIVFPFLTAYFAWKHGIQPKRVLILLTAFLLPALYINILPGDDTRDTFILACIHLPVFLWTMTGVAFAGDSLNDYRKRMEFLRFNGDLVVMTGLILIAGAALTGITLGLFELIDLKIEEFYFHHIGIWGLAAAPILGTHLVRTNPQLVNKVSPVIARVFTPLVLVMLVVYLGAVIYTGKDPYNDREFLLIFNLLLIGVMAIILFSIAEIPKTSKGKTGIALLFLLSLVTVIINGIALSAIVFRISAWGFTPNRLAVLGSNLLILTNLLFVAYRLFKTLRNGHEIGGVEKSMAAFLPIYAAWALLVTFLFPVMFRFQ